MNDNMKLNVKKERKRMGDGVKHPQNAVNRGDINLPTVDFRANGEINTDPFGSWTGVPADDPYEKPIQDADDL